MGVLFTDSETGAQIDIFDVGKECSGRQGKSQTITLKEVDSFSYQKTPPFFTFTIPNKTFRWSVTQGAKTHEAWVTAFRQAFQHHGLYEKVWKHRSAPGSGPSTPGSPRSARSAASTPSP